MSRLWKKKKVNVARFNLVPSETFQRDCYGFSDRLHARLLACHKTRRHKDTRHSHAKGIFTLPDKMRLFFCHSDYSSRAFVLCLSPTQAHIALLYCIHPRKIKNNHNIIRTGVNCLISPTGPKGCSLFTLFTLSSLVCFCAGEKWIVCWAVVWNKQALLSNPARDG